MYVLFGKNYFVFARPNRKPNGVYGNSKWTMFLWADCSHIKSDRTNETSARSWFWGTGLQNCLGIFRYSYWLLCNSFVKFADQNFSDALRQGPLEEIYLKKGVPRTKFQGNPLSLRTSLIRSKRAHSRKNEVGFLFCFQNFLNNSRYWMTTCQVMITL